MISIKSQNFPAEKFSSAQKFVPDAVIDLRYAGCNNFTGTPVAGYYAPCAILTVAAAEALGKAAEILRYNGFRIIIYDAYRPRKAVEYFIKWAESPDWPGNKHFFPELSKPQIIKEGYIIERSSHSRGSTVDLGLCDMEGNEMDMGGFFDFFDPVSHHGAKVPPEAARRRDILSDAMAQAGFEAYQYEWWHYSLKNEPFPDTYWDFDITKEFL